MLCNLLTLSMVRLECLLTGHFLIKRREYSSGKEDSDDTGEAESSAEGCSNDTETSSSNDVANTSNAEESTVYYEASADVFEE